MRTRLTFVARLVIIALLLASCNLPVAEPMAAPTETVPNLTTLVTPSAIATAAPTPTLPNTVLARVAAGQGITIMDVHMVDLTNGWGIGGLNMAEDHVFRTQDGGATWRDVTPGQPAAAEGDSLTASGFFRDASNAWVVFGATTALPPYIYVWITHDGGENWQYSAIDSSISPEFFYPFLIDFPDATHGWLLVALGGGMNHQYVALLGTTDGGLTWNTLVTPNDDNDIQSCPKSDMVFFDANNGWLARDCRGLYSTPNIMHTTDGGLTWKSVDPPAPADQPNLFNDYACDTASPNPFSAAVVIMAMKCRSMEDFSVQKDYVYSTTDGGATWSTSALPADYSMGAGLTFLDPLNGFALGRKIYKTTDGGMTWTFVQEVFWDGQFSFVNASHAWAAVVNDNNESALVSTGSGGVHWDMLNPMVVP